MQVLSDKNPLETYLQASELIYKAVAHTLGPAGTNTAVVNKKGAHDIINDGYSIVSKLTSLDPAEAEALETVKLSTFETNRRGGDGPQPLYAHVLTPNGFVEIKDLSIGDVICGTNNTHQIVTGTYPKGVKRIYKVRFADGTSVECTDSHLWTVTTNGKQKTITLEEMIKTGTWKNHSGNRSFLYYTPHTQVEFSEKDVSVDPFLLGVLLGDGCFSSSNHNIEFTIGYNKVDSIIPKIKLPDGMFLSSLDYPNKHAIKYRLCGKDDSGVSMKELIKDIDLLGVNSCDKFIPDNYKYNTQEIRQAILEGLLATDGYINKRGKFEYSTTSSDLFNDVCELCRSLGYTIYTRIQANRDSAYGDKPLFCLTQLDGYKSGDKIVDIIDTGKDEETMCIKVSNEDELYITDGYKVTHNTTSTSILTYKLLKGAKEYLDANPKVTKVQLRNILEETRDDYIDILHQTQSREILDEEFESIAKVSLGSSKYANIVSEAYRFLPEGLRPSVVRCDIPTVELEKKDGIVLDKIDVILPSDTFDKGPKEVSDLDVYLIYDKLDRWNSIQPVIEQIIRLKRRCILFYNELSMDILQNMQLQIVKGYADIIPIRLGSLGVQTRSTMNQLATYTGATLIDGVEVRLPKALNQVEIGKLDYALISSDTLIINNKDFTDLENISLPTKSCIIRVGGSNNAEMEESYRRIEDAVNSLGNALESGISVGAGITYQRICLQDNETRPAFIEEAMNSIYKQIIYNITGDTKISEENDGRVLTDNGSYELADDLKIYDATKVIEQVILNSFTLVAQIVTTNVMIVENVR